MMQSAMVILVAMAAVAAALFYNANKNEACTMDPAVTVEWLLLPEKSSINVSTCDVFSDTYWIARDRFRAAATAAAGTTVTPLIVYQEKNGVEYTMDIAVVKGKLPGVTVHISGTHGVEGYAGSAIQIAFLKELSEDILDHVGTIVIVHAFSPVGMATYRRFNEHNVDLNRNGLMESEWKSLTHSNAVNYDKFKEVFHPPTFSWFDAHFVSWWRTITSVAEHGILTLKTAMVVGQYHEPTGIFYGGTETEPSLLLLKDWMEIFMQEHLTEAVTWCDVHTGLGKMGDDTLVPSTTVEAPKDTLKWFPGSNLEDPSVSEGYEFVKGLTTDYYLQHLIPLSDEKHWFFGQEFGTRHSVFVGHAMVVENAAYHAISDAQERVEWAKQTTGAAFYPANSMWRAKVLQRGLIILQQAVQRSVQLSIPKSATEGGSADDEMTAEM